VSTNQPADEVAKPPLSPDEAARLIEFARACKAAARAVVLYPSGHPAITATLGRIVQLTAPAALPVPMQVTVHPNALLLDERGLARGEAAVTELAELLHSHLIGQMTIRAGGDADAWRSFLLLLARAPESIRADGGIARVWTTMAGRHIELREIDYAEVLRERSAGESAVWNSIVANCLQGMAFDLDEDAIKDLLGIAGDSERLAELMSQVESTAGQTMSVGAKSAALLRMLRGIVEAVTKHRPDQLEPVLDNMATGIGRLTPEMLLGLFEQRDHEDSSGGGGVVNQVVSRMSDGTIARFVARNIIQEATATERLAVAFQSLVHDEGARPRLLALAKEDVEASPLGNNEGFQTVWDHVAEKLLTSYSDKSYVGDAYARELSGAREQAIEVEQVNDDPPDRISGWLSTVATTALRALDITLLLDLLRIEEDDERWAAMMTPVVRLLEDLMLVGDFDAARQLVEVLVTTAAGPASKARRQHAMIAIDMLVAGTMIRHLIGHLATVDEATFEKLKVMCVSLGKVLVRPIAEAIAVEQSSRPRERLTIILIAFGNEAKKTVEQLKNSQNAAVRRTAILLMRQFGGSEALPDLQELVDDNEPQVQREAVRAILTIGTDAAYKILQQALSSGTEQTREAIMQSLSLQRDERAAPLFAYIVRHVDHRGRLGTVYLRAIESLGALRDPEGISPLREALYRGEWWAPRRNALLRGAAAAALARIGTPEAISVLDEAAASGSRGIRNVVKPHLASRDRRRAVAGTDA